MLRKKLMRTTLALALCAALLGNLAGAALRRYRRG